MAKTRGEATGGTTGAGGIPQATDAQGRQSVLIEFRHTSGASASFAMGMARSLAAPNFTLDEEFEPVSLRPISQGASFGVARGHGMAGSFGAEETYVVRGLVDSDADIQKLKMRPDVAEVWADTPIAPFPVSPLRDPDVNPQPSPAAAACPIPPCDCAPGTPQGTIADVATYLGVDRIWTAGFRGTGMVVGVVDSGITAQGRPVKPGETARRIPRVIGGWPTADWGTESGQWGDHGNMCGTDVLGMAPDAQLYDLRVAGPGGSPGTISRALQAFNWAISQHRLNGTPHVLSNSWGIFQETWDATYARNPNHPFTRKVVEAINEGILVLFAAGNCGNTCPDGRCGADNGPGRSIWGANGHPDVMTVGAVNRLEQFIGYSSQGPAALDPNKPDFCSISHFTGYNTSDNGTSAATPILAGVVALLKQSARAATQDQVKQSLRATAKDIGPAGFDQHSGAGIVQPFAALGHLGRIVGGATLPPQCGIIAPTQIGPNCPSTQSPQCVLTTAVGPNCPPPTLPPGCPPPSLPVVACPPPTQQPQCVLTTAVGPNCPPPTLPPGCPPPSLPVVACPPPTQQPQCVLTTAVGPNCPPPTLPPGCPPPSLPVVACPPPTQPPQCVLTTAVGPQCPPPTQAPPCPPPTLLPPCPPRTLGPPCPPPTQVGPNCPPPTQLFICPPPTAPPQCPPTQVGPNCPPPTQLFICPPPTAPPQCPPTQVGPNCPPPTQLFICPPPTAPPQCPPPTLVGPNCPPRTIPPLCPPVTQPPQCVPPTLPPQCPPPTLVGPNCPPRTLPPACPPVTQPPQCVPPTLVGPNCPPRTIAPPCPPPTQPPQCPPRTFPPACPPLTQPPVCGPVTQVPGCPPRPTEPPICGPVTALPGCPRPTLACPTLACFAAPEWGSGGYGYYVDPSWYGNQYQGAYVDPSQGAYSDPSQGAYVDPWAAYYAAVYAAYNPGSYGQGEYASYPGEYWTGTAG